MGYIITQTRLQENFLFDGFGGSAEETIPVGNFNFFPSLSSKGAGRIGRGLR